MTGPEQEALSHQHFGVWLVPLASGAVAAFNHPNGRLLGIASSLHEVMGYAKPVPPPEERRPKQLALSGFGDIDISDL